MLSWLKKTGVEKDEGNEAPSNDQSSSIIKEDVSQAKPESVETCSPIGGGHCEKNERSGYSDCNPRVIKELAILPFDCSSIDDIVTEQVLFKRFQLKNF